MLHGYMWRRVLSWMYSVCSLKTLSEIIYLPHQLQLKCVEGVSQAGICSLGCISGRTSLLSLQMVSKEACYKGPPFKTRFGWVSVLGKGKKRCATLRRDRISEQLVLIWQRIYFRIYIQTRSLWALRARLLVGGSLGLLTHYPTANTLSNPWIVC